MSKYVAFDNVHFRDLECLTQALVDVGFKASEIEVAPVGAPVHLFGYENDRRAEVADVVVRRGAVNRLSGGSSNDLGFRLVDGEYRPLVSDYDQGALRPVVGGKKSRDPFLQELERAYNTRLVPKIGLRLGLAMSAPTVRGRTVVYVGKGR